MTGGNPPSDTLREALGLHHAGRLAEAEAAYCKVLPVGAAQFRRAAFPGRAARAARRHGRSGGADRPGAGDQCQRAHGAFPSGGGTAVAGADGRRAGGLRTGDCAEAPFSGSAYRPHRYPAQSGSQPGCTGRLRSCAGARAAPASSPQQPRQGASRAAQAGRGDECLRPGDCGKARLCRRVLQPQPCASGVEPEGRGAGRVRPRGRAQAGSRGGAQQPQ